MSHKKSNLELKHTKSNYEWWRRSTAEKSGNILEHEKKTGAGKNELREKMNKAKDKPRL
jgi:hypothetical protein